MAYTLKKGETAIVLRPVIEEGEFTGSVMTGLVVADGQSETALRACIDIALTMAASLEYVEDYPEVTEIFDAYKTPLLEDFFPSEYEEAQKELAARKEYDKKGNVLTLNAWTKTEGSA